MARAFLASIPLALVLVAAVIVPVAVTPGSFGFHGWPEPHQELALEAPLVVEVADQPAPAGPRREPKHSKAPEAAALLVASAPEAPERRPGRRPAATAPAAQTPASSPPPAVPAAPEAPEQVAQVPDVPQVRDVAPAIPAAAPPVHQARIDTASQKAGKVRRKRAGKWAQIHGKKAREGR